MSASFKAISGSKHPLFSDDVEEVASDLKRARMNAPRRGGRQRAKRVIPVTSTMSSSITKLITRSLTNETKSAKPYEVTQPTTILNHQLLFHLLYHV